MKYLQLGALMIRGELYDAPREFRLTWLAWLEGVVDYATTNHDSELLAAIVGNDYGRVENLLYKRLCQSRRSARETFGVPRLGRRVSRQTKDAYEAYLKAPGPIQSLEGFLSDGEQFFAFVRAVRTDVKRKYRQTVLEPYEYTRMLEWKNVQTLRAR